MKKIYLLLILIFLSGLFLRLNIFGMNDHPAFAYTYDANNHLALAEHVYDGNIKYMPAHMSQGLKDVEFFQVPFPYVFSALLSRILGLSYFNGFYLSACVFDALAIICLFFIGKKICRDNTGITAAILYIVPLPVSVWWLTYKTGMFTVIFSAGLTALILWMMLEYLKERRHAYALSFAIACLLLTHFFEGMIMGFCASCLMLWKKRVKDTIILALINIMPLIYFYPRIIFVWNALKPAGFHLVPEITSALGFMITVDETFSFLFPACAVIAVLFLITNKTWSDEKKLFSGINALFMILVFVVIYFVSEAEYYIKLKYIMPILLIPFMAYVIVSAAKKIKIRFALQIIILFFLMLQIHQYLVFMDSIGEMPLMTAEQYDFLKSIRSITPEDAKIMMMPGYEGWKCLMTRRVCFEADDGFLKYNYTGGKIFGIYAGHGMNLPKKLSYLNWESRREMRNVDYLYSYVELKDFDHIVEKDRIYSISS